MTKEQQGSRRPAVTERPAKCKPALRYGDRKYAVNIAEKLIGLPGMSEDRRNRALRRACAVPLLLGAGTLGGAAGAGTG